MVRAEKVDLARLSIKALVDAFATALETALREQQSGAAAPLGLWGEWLVMAATLAQLRSRLLLPKDAPEARAAVHEAEALRRRLIDRARIEAAVDWLEARPQLGRDVFPRGTPEASPGRVGDVTELLRACLVALRLPPEETDSDRYLRRPSLWRAGDARARIEHLLARLPDGSSLLAYLPSINGAARPLRLRAAIAGTLVAALELARGGTNILTLDQRWPWAEIAICRSGAATRRSHNDTLPVEHLANNRSTTEVV